MKSTDKVGITFANLVLGRGILNGVVNVTLGAYEFNPDESVHGVDPAPAIVSRLRLDITCAKSLRDALDDLLKAIEAPMPPAPELEGADKDKKADANGAAKH